MMERDATRQLKKLEARYLRPRKAVTVGLAAFMTLVLVGAVSLIVQFGVERMTGFLEHEFVVILILSAALGGIFLAAEFAWKAGKRIDISAALSAERTRIANAAAAKLKQARQLLADGDDNLKEAIRLRDAALRQDLTSAGTKVRNSGLHSLLSDVNRRIEGARSRIYVRDQKDRRLAVEHLRNQMLPERDTLAHRSGTRHRGTVNEPSKRSEARPRGQKPNPSRRAGIIQARLLHDLDNLASDYESQKLKQLKNYAQRSRKQQRKAMVVGVVVIAVMMIAAVVLIGATNAGGGFTNSLAFLR